VLIKVCKNCFRLRDRIYKFTNISEELVVFMFRPRSFTSKEEVVSSSETFTDVYKSNIPKDSSLILFLIPQARSKSYVFLPMFLVAGGV
jgi:hypothetical protein